MATTTFQMPFVVREALVVAQATAAHISGSTVASAPMTVRLKTDHPEETPEYHEKYGVTQAYFHFGGGMAVTVTMTSWLSAYGEHWAVNAVRARFYEKRNGRQRPSSEKTEKIWEGTELDQLAELWGNSPYRWQG